MNRSLLRLIFGLMAVSLLLAPARAADDKKEKPSEADIQKAKDAVKKASDNLSDAYKKLDEAWKKLDDLEGRPARRGWGWGRWGDMRRPDPKKTEPPKKTDPPKADDIDKKLDRLMRELEELRKEIRKMK